MPRPERAHPPEISAPGLGLEGAEAGDVVALCRVVVGDGNAHRREARSRSQLPNEVRRRVAPPLRARPVASWPPRLREAPRSRRDPVGAEESEEGAVRADPLLVGREVVELVGLGHVGLRTHVERRQEVSDSRFGPGKADGEDLEPERHSRRTAVSRNRERADIAARQRAVRHLELHENGLILLLRHAGAPVPRLEGIGHQPSSGGDEVCEEEPYREGARARPFNRDGDSLRTSHDEKRPLTLTDCRVVDELSPSAGWQATGSGNRLRRRVRNDGRRAVRRSASSPLERGETHKCCSKQTTKGRRRRLLSSLPQSANRSVALPRPP
jgi:hypothetical protein